MKNKINFIIPGIIKSGGMNVIKEYSIRLMNKGYDIVLYYPLGYYNLYTGKNEYSIKPKRLYWTIQNYLNGIRNKKSLNSLVIKGVPFINDRFIRKADYVIATSWPTAYDISKLDPSKGVKYYFIQDIETWESNDNLVHNSYKLNLNSITICNYLRDILLKNYGVHSEVIMNGIDYNVFFPFAYKDFYKSEKIISYIDYKLDKKNTKSVIDAVIRIKNEFPVLRFKSFGLERFHRHPEYVSFYENPSQQQIAKIYNESHIFIFGSKEEGFGLPPAEAMSCKTAVVSTYVGAVPEYSENFSSILFTDNDSSEAIFDKVKILLSNNELCKNISENGYNSVRKYLNWEDSVDKFIKLLI